MRAIAAFSPRFGKSKGGSRRLGSAAVGGLFHGGRAGFRRFQLRQLCGGGFPLGDFSGQRIDDVHQFEVDLHRCSRLPRSFAALTLRLLFGTLLA